MLPPKASQPREKSDSTSVRVLHISDPASLTILFKALHMSSKMLSAKEHMASYVLLSTAQQGARSPSRK
jgi:hypothetical protein